MEEKQYQDLTDIEGNTKIGVSLTDDKLYDLQDQIKNLNNLGKNYLENVEDIKEKIDEISDLFYYINRYYLSIPDIDKVLSSTKLTKLIYRLLFVDMYNIILPNYLHITKFIQYDSIDEFIQLNYSSEKVGNLKNDLLKSIEIVVRSVKEFKKLIKDFNNVDKKFTDLDEILQTFAYYAEVIGNNSDNSLRIFLKNYLYKVLNSYKDDLIWRSE